MLSKKWCAQLLDGSLTDHKSYVSGCYRGYHVVCYEINNKSTQIVNIPVFSASDPTGFTLNGFLNSLLPMYKQLKGASVDGHSLTLTFVVGTAKKFVEIANDAVNRVICYLAQYGYVSCCSVCGNPGSAELYLVNGRYVWLCPADAAGYVEELERQKAESKTQKSNLLFGIVGAFLGALAGAVLYFVIYQLGFIAGISGLVMAVLAMKLYEKFGGCLDLKGVIASIVIVMVMVFFANKVAWAWEAYQALKGNDWTFFDCFRNLDAILELSDLKGSYGSDLFVSYLISIVGCLGKFIAAARGSTGSYSFKKLES